MGTQITIEIKDLVEAGWSCEVFEQMATELDSDGDDIGFIDSYLIIKKDGWEFGSYAVDCFHADCNEWGSNIHRFKSAGLFNIPHVLG